MDSLPSEILLDIFSRLPVKSILKCKCVCKSWYNILGDPRLPEMQLNRSSEDDDTLIIQVERDNLLYSVHHNELQNVPESEGHMFNHHRLGSDSFVVASCNGLLCLSEYDTDHPRFIYNPVNGECVKLPLCDIDDSLWRVRGIGFCYDPETKEYKVILVWEFLRLENGDKTPLLVQIWTLGTDHWRGVVMALGDYRFGWLSFQVLLNGIPYFHSYRDDSDEVILAFDIVGEKFRAIALPKDWSYEKWAGGLGSLKGCLAVAVPTPSSFTLSLDVWIMTKDVHEKSWKLSYKISTDFTDVLPYNGVAKPLRVLKDGSILLWLECELLISYNPTTGDVRRIDSESYLRPQEKLNPLTDPRIYVVNHRHSLLSLKGYVHY